MTSQALNLSLEHQGGWLRRSRNGINVVFIHGFTSDEKCWLNDNGAYWPELLLNQQTISNCGIYIFTYRTGFNTGTYSLGDVVDSLYEYFCIDHLFDGCAVVFVCHSMGGIVARRFLVKQSQELIHRNLRKVGLFLVASPSLGSRYASFFGILTSILGHNQAKALEFSQSNVWLAELDNDFMALRDRNEIEVKGKELIEDLALIGKRFFIPQVVEPFSGNRYFGNPYKVPGSNHITIAKPEHEGSVQHRILTEFIESLQRTWVLSGIPGGLANQIMSAPLGCQDPVSRKVDQQLHSTEQRYLSLIFKEGEELEDDPNWGNRDSPWDVRSYTFESWIYYPSCGHYQQLSFEADLGNFLLASTEVSPPGLVARNRSTFGDLIQAAFEWISKQPDKIEYTTLELFVPIELLSFDWGGIKLRLKIGCEELYKRIPFVLRSADRFCEETLRAKRPYLPEKYEQLRSGKGRWIAGSSAQELEELGASGRKSDLVALKRLQPLDATPQHRLVWQWRVVEAMLPLAIWWRSNEQDPEGARQKHLDEFYEGLLSTSNDGDPLQWSSCQLDKLPGLRFDSTDPIARNLVLLLDCPDRHPWIKPTPLRSV